MADSVSLAALVRGVKRLWPGCTVWTKGDLAHQSSSSDHNNDDTAGSKPEQTDADNIPEVRAADIPTLGGVTMAKLDQLRVRLTTRPSNQRRLRYVILRQSIWRKRNGWVREDYSGEYHGHLHASVDVADDNNSSEWDIGPDVVPIPPVSPRFEEDDMAFLVHAIDDQGTQIGTDDEAIFAVVGGGGCWVADRQVPQTLANKLAVPPSAPDKGFGNSSGLNKAEWNALMDMYNVDGHRFVVNADGTLGDWVSGPTSA